MPEEGETARRTHGGVNLKKENNGKLRIIPLGGLEKIGMNITAFEYEDSIIVVDLSLIHISEPTRH